jgi:hypothetical protein
MPTVAEIKNQLKLLKIKGITGKTKAQLFEMLPEGNCLKFVPVKKARVAKPAPEPAPVPIKAPAAKKAVGTAVANPARPAIRTIQNKVITETSLPGKKVAAEKLAKFPVVKKTVKKEKKHKFANIDDALLKVLIHNGYNEEESDYEFMEGMEDQYAEVVIEDMLKDGYTRKEIAFQAARMDEGYTMFDDLIEEYPAARKIRRDLKGD